MEGKPRKPFYQSVWFFALIGVIVVRFVLPDSDNKKYRDIMDEAEAQYESGNLDQANILVASAVELRPEGTRSEELSKKISTEKKNNQKAEKKKIEETREQEKLDQREQEKNAWINEFDNPIEQNVASTALNIFAPADSDPSDIVRETTYNSSDKTINITVLGKDGWSDKSIGLGFYEDTTTLYSELSEDNRIDELWINILFPMKDTNGKVSEEEVMSTWMSRETMNMIDWETFDYQKILDVVDGKTIYPQFVQ